MLHPVGPCRSASASCRSICTLDKFGSQKPTDANRFSLCRLRTALTKDARPAGAVRAGAVPQLGRRRQAVAAGLCAAGQRHRARRHRHHLRVRHRDHPHRALRPHDHRHQAAPRAFSSSSRAARRRCSAISCAAPSVARSPLSQFPHGADASVCRTRGGHAGDLRGGAHVRTTRVFHPDAAAFTSQAAANDYVARAVASDPTLAGTLHVLPQFEMAA